MTDAASLYDVIIIGGGPAGLTAAIYLARARYRVLVVEKGDIGGQITITEEVVNYPGVASTSGRALTEAMRRQAEGFGAEFLAAEATAIGREGDLRLVRTDRGERRCFGVLLATGAHPRRVGFRGEDAFRGRGVAYCATCDGEFFTGRDVFVVGGGYAAAEESVFLTKFARHVTILMLTDDFTCAQAVAEPARRHERITVLPRTELVEVDGDGGLTRARWRSTLTGEETTFTAAPGETFGVFVFAGYEPATALLRGVAELDGQGYVITDRTLRTSAEGIYAAGDVCIKPLRQVVTATGDGALAATELEKYAAAMQRKTGLHPRPPAPTIRPGGSAEPADPGSDLLDPGMREQLHTLFARLKRPLLLQLLLDGRPVSAELERFMGELAAMTDKLTVQTAQRDASPDVAPCVRICQADGTPTGLAFHGVPGGHEFTAFVLGLYHAADPAHGLDDATRAAVAALDGPVRMQVLVSLSCTMCPDLVTAAQRVAALHPDAGAEVFDIAHFPGLKDRYQLMSVPCLVVNGERVAFGRKNLQQLLDYLSS